MYFFDKSQYQKLLREACDVAKRNSGMEICGLIVHTGFHLKFVQTRNVSRKAGSFIFSKSDVRKIVAAARILGQEVVGTFHSHPAGLAIPGDSDIKYAVDDSLMFIFDCHDKTGNLWRIRKGRAQNMKFDFASLKRYLHEALK
jgi:proteasome lid subunit RPN8/RPN11